MSSVARSFCWVPTPVWNALWYRDGFVWLRFAYKHGGKFYREEWQAVAAANGW